MFLRRGTGRIVAAVLALLGGGSCGLSPSGDCPDAPPATTIDVTGTYRYSGVAPLSLSGTITFEQTGRRVLLVNTTYDLGGNRPLVGEANLDDNVLQMALIPENGDTDYRADVTFVFSDDGKQFCVAFRDTNNDSGSLGSFRGERLR